MKQKTNVKRDTLVLTIKLYVFFQTLALYCVINVLCHAFFPVIISTVFIYSITSYFFFQPITSSLISAKVSTTLVTSLPSARTTTFVNIVPQPAVTFGKQFTSFYCNSAKFPYRCMILCRHFYTIPIIMVMEASFPFCRAAPTMASLTC